MIEPEKIKGTDVAVVTTGRRPRHLIAVPLYIVVSVSLLLVTTIVLIIWGGYQQGQVLAEGRKQRIAAINQVDQKVDALTEQLRSSLCRSLLIRDQSDPTVQSLERDYRCSIRDLAPGAIAAPGAPTDPLTDGP